jgi:hypothetical protein
MEGGPLPQGKTKSCKQNRGREKKESGGVTIHIGLYDIGAFQSIIEPDVPLSLFTMNYGIISE